ncbi:MAG: hypothetical protein CVT88_09075 [Candidatus Altiarchaeales archaeon HGW-Altiarchaeales-1]|nr:MAG: hypothetical protein CVT88_09075 [Candidatus Altiarchaeales archaeon HGW-Altiarchaeales-1]PKP57800.1 MAG: hypothetical protein CVT89_03895 [Candidatus Altiarchaeales archaeon HGW-Altiarchaeales-2]
MESVTISLTEEISKKLRYITSAEQISLYDAIKTAVNEYYLKGVRAQIESESIQRLYSEDVIDKEILFKLLPAKDAEAIIIGVDSAKKAYPAAKNVWKKANINI